MTEVLTRIQLNIASRCSEVSLLGATVNVLCTHLGLDEVQAFQAELALVEAANNIVMYAYEAQPQHRLELEITVHKNRIIFILRDQGRPAGELQRPECPVPENPIIEELPEGNMGLYIIYSIMDEVAYSSQGETNIMRMVKYLPHPAE